MIGSGYVGLVSGACFSEFGHSVDCVDYDPEKVKRLRAGEVPIYEPGLDALIETNTKEGRLFFSSDLVGAVRAAEIIFIAVGTPGRGGDGAVDMQFVDDAAREIAVMAPYRAQVRLLRSAIQHKGLPGIEELTIDTVERIQGQEREVVVISLAAGDPAAHRSRGTFHLSENRLNVAVSRARTKAVLVASGHVFEALPRDVAGLRAVSKSRELRDRMQMVDLTKLYVGGGAGSATGE